MNLRYIVELTEQERKKLIDLTRSGQPGARIMKRAQILLMADLGKLDRDIAEARPTGTSTVYRTKRRFVEGGLEHALHDRRRPGGKKKLSGNEEALLVATACSDPPEGRARWTLELLAGELVRLTQHDSLSKETVRRRLHENELKPWRKEMWCIPTVDTEFIARMEDVLELHTEPVDQDDPIVSFDESSVQLIGEARTPLPTKPGQPERYDYDQIGPDSRGSRTPEVGDLGFRGPRVEIPIPRSENACRTSDIMSANIDPEMRIPCRASTRSRVDRDEVVAPVNLHRGTEAFKAANLEGYASTSSRASVHRPGASSMG